MCLALQSDHVKSIIELAVQKEYHFLVLMVVVLILLVLVPDGSSLPELVSFHIAIDGSPEGFKASLVLWVRFYRPEICLGCRALVVRIVGLKVRCSHQAATKVAETPKGHIGDDKHRQIVGGAIAGINHGSHEGLCPLGNPSHGLGNRFEMGHVRFRCRSFAVEELVILHINAFN